MAKLVKMSKSHARTLSIGAIAECVRTKARQSELKYWLTRHGLAKQFNQEPPHMLSAEIIEAIAREFCSLEDIDPDADSGTMPCNEKGETTVLPNWKLFVSEIKRTYNILTAIERNLPKGDSYDRA